MEKKEKKEQKTQEIRSTTLYFEALKQWNWSIIDYRLYRSVNFYTMQWMINVCLILAKSPEDVQFLTFASIHKQSTIAP